MNPLRKQQQPVSNDITTTIELPLQPGALSLGEKKDLECCELEIRKGLGVFLRVAQALLEIKERKLYRGKHSTFEHYCEEIWGFKRHYAYHLVSAAEVCSKMLTMVNIALPENERQVRALRGLSAEKATEAWKRAAELAGEHKITGEIVKTAVAEVCPPTSTNLHPKLNWQLTVEPLLKEALRFAKSGDRDKVEQLVQRALLLLGVGQGPKLST